MVIELTIAIIAIMTITLPDIESDTDLYPYLYYLLKYLRVGIILLM